MSEVCSIAGKETGIVSHRVHAYRVDPDRLRGNGGLDAGYGAFVARMEETLVRTVGLINARNGKLTDLSPMRKGQDNLTARLPSHLHSL